MFPLPRNCCGAAFRSGNGTVQSAAAGGSASQSVTVRMDDGTTQALTVQGGASFQPGERVAIGTDGRIQPRNGR